MYFDSTIPFLGIYPIEMLDLSVEKIRATKVFIVAVCTNKTLETLEIPQQEIGYIELSTVKYSTAIRRRNFSYVLPQYKNSQFLLRKKASINNSIMYFV